MTRERFDRQLHHIQDEILLLGSMVEQAVQRSMESLRKRDVRVAKKIYEDDRMINDKRFALENAILIQFATQQPMAHDMRLLAAMLEVTTELERMGDYAKGIAKVTIRLGDSPISIPVAEFSEMTELAVSMLHRALTAFVSEDINLAIRIPDDDDKVDNLYNDVYRKLVNSMIANPTTIDDSNLLMWVAHNLERMADRVTNICERTVFIATGELFEVDEDEEEEDIE